MTYLEQERTFFEQFVVGDYDQYLERKKQHGVWGDDLEIQALSEIYNRSVEIYAYRAQPMRTFHEEKRRGSKPIRLSYHGNEHYNSIVEIEDG